MTACLTFNVALTAGYHTVTPNTHVEATQAHVTHHHIPSRNLLPNHFIFPKIFLKNHFFSVDQFDSFLPKKPRINHTIPDHPTMPVAFFSVKSTTLSMRSHRSEDATPDLRASSSRAVNFLSPSYA